MKLLNNQGLLFDYGGTLDTGGHHWGRVLWQSYERMGVPVSETLFREAYVYGERTLGRNPIIQPDFTFHRTLETKIGLQMDYLVEHGAKVDKQLMGDSVLRDVYQRTLQCTAHSVSVLSQLAKSHKMVLVSNFYGNVGVVIEEMGMNGLFQTIIESAVVGIRKPDPRIFTLGVEALGMKPNDVTVIGDSIDKDILPAKKAGCHTVWFEGLQWTDTPVDRTAPDAIITDLNQLII